MLSGEFHTSYASDMGIFETRRAGWVLAAFIVALFAIPFVAGSYWLDVANRAAIAVIAATGLNILTGFTGQISLGNAAFLAVGASTTAFLANHAPPFVVASPVGKAFVAIRDQDISAEVMGVDVFRYKLLSFAVSSFYVGVAGSLLAYQARIISPENFPLGVAIDHLGMIIIGGLGSVLGSILGAVFLTLLPEVLRLATSALSGSFPHLVQLFTPLKVAVFGLTIVLFLIFEPDGLADLWRRVRNWFRLYPFSY